MKKGMEMKALVIWEFVDAFIEKQCCSLKSWNLAHLSVSGKAKRLKEAKEEAHAEIEAYRQKREKEFREHESKVP